LVEAILGIRRHDRRDAAVGFVTLLLIMAGHAILETARDALFLATLPPTLLPWAYLAMAGLALLVAQANTALLERFSRRRLLSISLLVGAAVTGAFWLFSSLAGSAGSLVAFYVWTGLLATIVVVQFWLLLGDVLDFGQAKRVFAVIGAGGLIGAALGSGIAGAVLLFFRPQALLLTACLIFVLAAFLPFGFSRVRKDHVTRGERALIGASGVELLSKDPYLRRLLGFVLLSTLCVTFSDFLFKTVVSHEIPAERLGDFFARYYAVINVLALAVQVLIAPRLLRVMGVNRTLLALPLLLLVGSAGFALTGGLAAVLLLKGSDGALRHSVNRTGTEILYLPLSSQIRDRFKSFVEAVAQRGGQALASLAILGAIFFGLGPRALGWTVVALCVLCVFAVIGLERQYLDLFRRQLREGQIDTRSDVPELDLETLEALLSALSAEDDAEVTAALDLFEAYEKTRLIPALILYHPARSVVLRAFELFETAPRPDVTRLAGRLLAHSDNEIRAAALRYYASTDASGELFRRSTSESPPVRATAIVGMVARGMCSDEEAQRSIEAVLSSDSPEARQALGLSLRLLPADRYLWVAERLAFHDEPGLSQLVARSIASSPDPDHIPVLIRLLEDRTARNDARTALVALGDAALDRLEQAMADQELPRALRRHLPRTISRFRGLRPAEILLRFLESEIDDAIEYKILRGLGRMRTIDPDVPIDRDRLLEVARKYLREAIEALYFRLTVDSARSRTPSINTPAAELLTALLRDHEINALERVFRTLHIFEPSEEFRMIFDGLRSAEAKTRASSRELLEHVVPAPIRDGVLAMVDDALPAERLENAVAFYDPSGREGFQLLELERQSAVAISDMNRQKTVERELGVAYAECLRSMLGHRSEVLRSVASYHIAELGLGDLKADLAAVSRRSGFFRGLTESAIDLLESSRRPELRGAH
jgi:ATP:ADP antiporter, AAA family